MSKKTKNKKVKKMDNAELSDKIYKAIHPIVYGQKLSEALLALNNNIWALIEKNRK